MRDITFTLKPSIICVTDIEEFPFLLPSHLLPEMLSSSSSLSDLLLFENPSFHLLPELLSSPSSLCDLLLLELLSSPSSLCDLLLPEL